MKDTPGHLYVLQVTPWGAIKIGWTRGLPSRRARAIQQASPHLLAWIGACPAVKADEAAAHKLLHAHRYRGEWFNPSEAVLAFVHEKSPAFDQAAYMQEHFRGDLQDRVKALAAYSRDDVLRGRLLKASGMPTPFDFYAWTNSQRTLPPEGAASLERELDALDLADASPRSARSHARRRAS